MFLSAACRINLCQSLPHINDMIQVIVLLSYQPLCFYYNILNKIEKKPPNLWKKMFAAVYLFQECSSEWCGLRALTSKRGEVASTENPVMACSAHLSDTVI